MSFGIIHLILDSTQSGLDMAQESCTLFGAIGSVLLFGVFWLVCGNIWILGPGYVPEDCKQGNMGDNLIWRFAQVMVFAADVTMPISIVALVWWMWTSPPQESCEELREDYEAFAILTVGDSAATSNARLGFDPSQAAWIEANDAFLWNARRNQRPSFQPPTLMPENGPESLNADENTVYYF
mmetsp:Transcript_2596/g.7246  ORF Transcript_2596/g.7246 Transcript_2596/m.7246 type:complete len:182 (-) Transcript_2596:746-1291(-)